MALAPSPAEALDRLVKFHSIQVMRGIAALLVVLAHATQFYPGMVGVDLFFVISGFIIATVARGEPGSFLLARLWRVFPIYLLCALPWLAQSRDLAQTLSTITLWPIWNDQFVRPAMPVAWTLCFELLFYFSVCVGMATRKWVPLLAYLICFGLFATRDEPVWAFCGSPLVLEFLAGALITKLPRRRSIGVLCIVLGVAFWIVRMAEYSFHPGELEQFAQSLDRVRYWGVAAFLVVWGVVALEPIFRRSIFTPLIVLGDASYSLYLTHIGVTSILPGLISIPVCLVLALAVHRYVERPILASRRWLETVRMRPVRA